VDVPLGPQVKFQYAVNDSTLTVRQIRGARPSPDGRRLAFTALDKVWVMDLPKGAPRRLTTNTGTIGEHDPVWSPDGRRLAFVSKLSPPDPNPGSDVKVITDARYKFDGEGFLEGKHRHIWNVAVDRDGAEPERVTDGDFEHSAPAWSPTGRELAFAANRNPDWQFERSRDIWAVVPGSAPRRLTPGDGWFDLPVWSPDGRHVACVGHRKLDLEAPNEEIWLLPAGGGEPRSLTAGFDRGAGDQAIADIGQFRRLPPRRRLRPGRRRHARHCRLRPGDAVRGPRSPRRRRACPHALQRRPDGRGRRRRPRALLGRGRRRLARPGLDYAPA
jgi:Tol biopolymer transport system component